MTPRPLAALTLGAVLAVSAACGSAPLEEVTTTGAVPVTVEAARLEHLEAVIATTGMVTIAPGAESTIVAPEAARIAELPKAEGDRVSKDEVLVRFDIPSLAAALASARAAVAYAEARVATTRAAVVRVSDLFDKGVAARREIEEARRNQAEADADLAQATGAVAAATALAERAVVRATFSGVVARRWHNPGDLVDPSSADPVLRVIDPTRLEIVASVPLADLARIVPGHAARITGPGGADEPARIVTRPAQVDPGSSTADVRLAFVAATRLAAGTPVRVAIVADDRPEAVVTAASAVVRDGGETFVFVAGPDNVAHRRAVTVGLTSGGLVEIASGLAAGDLVIVRGHDGLPDGAAITVSR